MSAFAAGVVGVLVIILISYLAATKFANPFKSEYTIHALFTNANGLRPQSVVRIAGINVGGVQQIQPVPKCKESGMTSTQCTAADVEIMITNPGLPIHKDATFSIRPRIFLEGNFFVDINPGSPSAPIAPNGYVFPIQQGVEPVQFDQVLTSLQGDTRTNLQILLQQYGTAVKQGGPGYNASIQYWQPAYEWGAAASHDALGTQPHDLSNWINKAGSVNGALDMHPQNLKDLLHGLNVTAGAFARVNTQLEQAVRDLPTTLATAIPAFTSLNHALCSGGAAPPPCPSGPLPNLANALIPATKSTGPTVDASLPLFHQLRLLVQPSELRGLADDLKPTIPALAKLNAETITLMRNGVRPASSCVVNQIHPWTQLTINDPHFNASNGFPPRPVYVEGVDFLPGLAGESRDFDPNGPYIRILGTGGTFTYSLQPGLFGQALAPIAGTQPQLPAAHSSGDGAPAGVNRPPLQPNVPCETQPTITESNLNDAPTGTGPGQVSTSVDTPSARARRASAAQLAIASMRSTLKQEGMSLKVPNGAGK
jgi:ABC-type transporter Mla subunit MlaD